MENFVIDKDFEYKGLRCVVMFTDMGYYNGYVGVSKTHPLYGVSYLDDRTDNLECHGGLTYSTQDEDNDYPVPSDLWWFGFDFAHAWDKRDDQRVKELFPKKAWSSGFERPDCHAWTPEEVADEVKVLADQLAE